MSFIQKRFLFIKNANLKLCINCVNFIEEKNKLYGKCKKFGEQDLVTGEIDNAHASVCRMDNTKCGVSGRYFEEKIK